MDKFTATHHALMFAWISRAVVNAAGEKEGARIVRKAVVKYGLQRGRRMALRAKANGHELTMAGYIAYGEWKAGKKEMAQKIAKKVPHLRVHVLKCPWHTAWEKNGLKPYGRYFCMEVDEALVRGFNPNLVLEVKGTQTNHAPYCDFIFRDANFSALNMVRLVYRKLFSPGKTAIMPWAYHVGHLYKTMGEVIGDELAGPAGEIMSVALQDFSGRYGKEAGRVAKSYKNTDFDRLP